MINSELRLGWNFFLAMILQWWWPWIWCRNSRVVNFSFHKNRHFCQNDVYLTMFMSCVHKSFKGFMKDKTMIIMSIFVFRFSLKCSVCRLHQFYRQCAVLLIANCSCLQHLNSLFAANNSWSLSSSFMIFQECDQESEKTKDKHLAICLRFSATAMIHIVCIVHVSRRAEGRYCSKL